MTYEMQKYPDYDGTQNCAQWEVESFYYQDGVGSLTEGEKEHAEFLRTICNGCSFLEDCFKWAIHHELHGFWAGTTPEQRTNARRKLKIKLVQPQTVGK